MQHLSFRSVILSVLFVSTFLLSSCKKDDEKPSPAVGAAGFYIVNEGAFGNNNTSISFFDRATKTVSNDYFASANNGLPLGDQTQSMSIYNGKGYLVVQNSKKVTVVDISNFKLIANIQTDISSPRYFLGVNSEKGYVTDWKGSKLKVINLTTNTVTKTIDAPKGPEQLLLAGSKVFVSGVGAFPDYLNNTIAVFESTTDQAAGTITVGDNPTGMVLDANGKIWVACAGRTVYNADFSAIDEAASTVGSLVRINPNTLAIEATLPFPDKAKSPGRLSLNGAKNKLFYTYARKVYSLDITATALNTTPFLNRNFYGLAVDPTNDNILGGVAPTFSAAGKFIRYQSTGTPIDSFTVGIAPNSFVFK